MLGEQLQAENSADKTLPQKSLTSVDKGIYRAGLVLKILINGEVYMVQIAFFAHLCVELWYLMSPPIFS